MHFKRGFCIIMSSSDVKMEFILFFNRTREDHRRVISGMPVDKGVVSIVRD